MSHLVAGKGTPLIHLQCQREVKASLHVIALFRRLVSYLSVFCSRGSEIRMAWIDDPDEGSQASHLVALLLHPQETKIRSPYDLAG